MIKFELLTQENVNEVWELEKVCFDDPWSLGSFEQELGNRISFYSVARDDKSNAVVGYAGVWMMYDCANITNVAVAPSFRRSGLGTKLLCNLEEAAKKYGMESITLEARASNTAAIGLYIKNGFSKCGLRKKYYHNTEDAILMTKSLK